MINFKAAIGIAKFRCKDANKVDFFELLPLEY